MLALPDGKKKDFVKYSDASHKGLGCVLMQHGKKELNVCQRRQLELIKNNDWEILYHSGKANMVADALSKKERLKMIMSFGEFIRDFEKMKIEVKEVTFKNVKCKTGGLIPRKGDARYERYPNIEMTVEINNKRKAKEVANTLKDEVVERKMLGPAVVQRTKDMIDLIRGRLVVAQDGHDKHDKKGRRCGDFLTTQNQGQLDPSFPKTSQSFLRLPSSSHHFKEEFGIWNGSEMEWMDVGCMLDLRLVCGWF
ncbi:hypothetical protein AgCh_034012 [Apium graveolens]